MGKGQLIVVEQLIHDQGQGIHIGAEIGALAILDLRRHIGIGTHGLAHRGKAIVVHQLGLSEVAQLEIIDGGGIEYVFGLDIHVDQAEALAYLEALVQVVPDSEDRLEIAPAGILAQPGIQPDQLFHPDQDIPAEGIRAFIDGALLKVHHVAGAVELVHRLYLMHGIGVALAQLGANHVLPSVAASPEGIQLLFRLGNGDDLQNGDRLPAVLISIDGEHAAKGAFADFTAQKPFPKKRFVPSDPCLKAVHSFSRHIKVI